jgi:hypothetical protein
MSMPHIVGFSFAANLHLITVLSFFLDDSWRRRIGVPIALYCSRKAEGESEHNLYKTAQSSGLVQASFLLFTIEQYTEIRDIQITKELTAQMGVKGNINVFSRVNFAIYLH